VINRGFEKVIKGFFGLPSEPSKSVYRERIKFLLVFEFQLVSILMIVSNLFRSSLIYDQINFIFFALVFFVVLASWYVYQEPREVISFLLASSLALTLLTQTVILNIDRSRSFYVLNWVDKGSANFSNGEFNFDKVKSSEKLNEEGIISRIEEQISRGLINKNPQGVELSILGSILLKGSETIAVIFNLRGWAQNSQ
jgi:hypothetical protein